jgi:catalase
MEIRISDIVKWNVEVPTKAVQTGRYEIKYIPYNLVNAIWQPGNYIMVPITFPAGKATEFALLTAYQQLIFVIKLLVPGFTTAEDKLLQNVLESYTTDALKLALNTEINSAVTKMKVLTAADLNVAKVK